MAKAGVAMKGRAGVGARVPPRSHVRDSYELPLSIKSGLTWSAREARTAAEATPRAAKMLEVAQMPHCQRSTPFASPREQGYVWRCGLLLLDMFMGAAPQEGDACTCTCSYARTDRTNSCPAKHWLSRTPRDARSMAHRIGVGRARK